MAFECQGGTGRVERGLIFNIDGGIKKQQTYDGATVENGSGSGNLLSGGTGGSGNGGMP